MVKKICGIVLLIGSLSYVESVEKNSIDAVIAPEMIEQVEVAEIQLPEDVLGLLDKMKECSRWIEEWDPKFEAERRAMIEKKINKVCLQVISRRQELLDKYKDKVDILDHLN